MKLRQDSADRWAGSGCMARLVRFSSFVGRYVLMGLLTLIFVVLASGIVGVALGILQAWLKIP